MSEKSYSNEHARYVSGLRKLKRQTTVWQVMILIGFIGLWQISTEFGWIDPFIFSSPSRIAVTFYNLLTTDSLLSHLGITLLETVIGFLLGTLIGTGIAMSLWWFPKAAKIADPYLVVLNALPKVALGPLIIVLAGAGMKSILIMTLAISLISTIITVFVGFSQTDEEKLLLLRSFGAKKSQLFFKVILPSSYDNILSALKINVGLSWVGVIMGEFLVSKSGIGYLIMYGSQVFNFNLVMTGIIVLAFAAALMYYTVSAFEKKISRKFK